MRTPHERLKDARLRSPCLTAFRGFGDGATQNTDAEGGLQVASNCLAAVFAEAGRQQAKSPCGRSPARSVFVVASITGQRASGRRTGGVGVDF